MTKFLGWVCTLIWICIFNSGIICAVSGRPMTYDWTDVLLRDALIIVYSAGNLIREYC